MKISDEKSCPAQAREWRGEKFWRQVDKVSDFIGKPWFFWTSVALLVFGTILGVIAPYLK